MVSGKSALRQQKQNAYLWVLSYLLRVLPHWIQIGVMPRPNGLPFDCSSLRPYVLNPFLFVFISYWFILNTSIVFCFIKGTMEWSVSLAKGTFRKPLDKFFLPVNETMWSGLATNNPGRTIYDRGFACPRSQSFCLILLVIKTGSFQPDQCCRHNLEVKLLIIIETEIASVPERKTVTAVSVPAYF